MVPVRPALPHDLPAIMRRWAELMDAHRGLDPQLYATAPNAPDTYIAYVRRRLDDAEALVLVAPDPDTDDLFGYLVAGIGMRAPIYRVREVGMVFDCAVRPDLRRRGVGRSLVAAAEAWFRARGLRWAQVDFSPGNPEAVPFWTGLGYRTLLQEAYRPL